MRLLLVALLLIPAVTFAGKIYRWVDAQGQVHFGEQPPQGSAATAHRPALSKSAGTPESSKPASPAPAVASAAAPAAAPITAEAKAKAAKEAKAKNCVAAKERIQFLETNTAHRIQVPQKDGSTARMTDEEFDKGLADAKKAAASDC